MASDNVAIVKAFLTELGVGSLDRAGDYLADGATWSLVQVVLGQSVTKDVLKQTIGAMRASFQDDAFLLKPLSFIEENDVLAVEVESFAETVLGKIYANKYCMIFKMAGGKIAEVREYNDSIHIDEVLFPAMAYVTSQTKPHVANDRDN